jgi:hypothetical protein
MSSPKTIIGTLIQKLGNHLPTINMVINAMRLRRQQRLLLKAIRKENGCLGICRSKVMTGTNSCRCVLQQLAELRKLELIEEYKDTKPTEDQV